MTSLSEVEGADEDSASVAREQLAKAVRARRLALGDLTQAQVTERGGPSTETLRLIEGARQDGYGQRTLSRLDRALNWPVGTSAGILADAPPSEEVCNGDADETLTDDDWQRLGKAVESRRLELGYPQEHLVELGGPSHQTVRNLERGKPNSYRPMTFSRLDRALDWPSGTSLGILDGTVAEVDPRGVSEDWAALAFAVRQRREQLRLRQRDLEARGGPSNGTICNIEQASRTKYSSRTFTQLETALAWPTGAVQKILSGVPVEAGLEVAQSSAAQEPVPCIDDQRLRQLALDLPPLLDALANALRKVFAE